MSYLQPVVYLTLMCSSVQEGKSRTGSARRKEDEKELTEVGTEESSALHDAKNARATWRR